MSKSNTKLDAIAEDIKRISKKADVPAFAITKAIYFANGGKYKEWDLRKVGGFIGIRNAYFEPEEKRDEVQVAGLAELRTEYRKLRKESGELDLLLDKIKDAVKTIPQLNLKPYKPSKKSTDPNESRTLNLLLSDLHFGSDLSSERGTKNYGKIEEARALAMIVKNVCDYKRQYRDHTKIVVNILGDIIENSLHGLSATDFLHIQTCRAMWLLSQAIVRFSESFPLVEVNFTVGNHGRDTSIHKTRASEIKFNAIETTIYYGTKLACKNLKNVTFRQPKTPWVSYSAEGHMTYVSHGDTNINPGNPGGKIDIKSLEGQTNKINASLKDDTEYKVFALGHVHQAMATILSNGVTLITNGPLVPPNEFAQSIGIVEATQIQVMWESTKKFAVGDFRFINAVDSENDETLDEIIKPFQGLDFI